MSNLKDTDIDDLFRRASDKYPLRTDSADWDRMAVALEKEPPAPPDAAGGDEDRKKRRFFWLFLLLPLAGAGYYVWQHAGSSGNMGRGASVVATTAAAKQPTAPADQTTPAAGPTATTTDQATSPNQPVAAPAAAQTTAPVDQATASHQATSKDQAATARTATPGETGTPGQTAASGKTATAGQAATTDHTANRQTQAASVMRSNHINRNEDTQPDNSLSLTAVNTRQQPGGENNVIAIPGGANGNDRLFYDLQRAPIPRDYRLAVDVTAPTARKDTTVKQPRNKTKHFYAGVFGSPDLSTVKMQSVKGVGSTFGLILGYTFNGGHWAIETGAYVDRKKYYTDGEYFNTKEVRVPTNSYLDDVDGTCYMWEIPLNVRYNFNPGAKTAWFATAGFSTYLMSHEKYTYGYNWRGSATVWDSTWNIHTPSQYPFSIINLSAGFEQRLGKIGNLRIEPYVRLPLTGLGTGKLPIMSAGVNIGITRQLW